jgi:hypothetical protein
MTETSLDLGIIILEPMTAATDLLLAVFCIYFYNRLRLPKPSEPLLKFWRLFFLIMGISTLFGTMAHGLRHYMSDDVFKFAWMGMNLSSVLSSYFLLLATIEMMRGDNEELLRRLQLIALIVTLLITGATLALNEFSLIKIYAGFVVLLAVYRNYATFKQGVKGTGLIAFGFGLSMLSILVHTAKFSLHEYFNFKDLSHIIILVSLYFIFMGAMIRTRMITAE